jgi:hypothetical protein
MADTAFEVGKTYSATSTYGKVSIKAIIGTRIFGEVSGGSYYTMYDMEGVFLGHWFQDDTKTHLLTMENPARYNLVKPKPPVVLTYKAIYNDGTADRNEYPDLTCHDNILGVFVFKNGELDRFYLIDELLKTFKNTGYRK